MKKITFLLSFLLVCNLCVSQTKVTDFAGTKATAPFDVKKIDVINNRLIFTANTIGESGAWSTDGKETWFLGGNEGGNFSYCAGISSKVEKDGTLYLTNCRRNEIFLIDSLGAKSVYDAGPNAFISVIYEFKGSVYAFNDYRLGQKSALLRLLPSGKTEVVEEEVVSVKFTEEGAFYMIPSNDSKTSTLYFFNGAEAFKIKEYNENRSLYTRLDVKLESSTASIVVTIEKAGSSHDSELLFYDTAKNSLLNAQNFGSQNPIRGRFVIGADAKTYAFSGVFANGNQRFLFDLHLLTPESYTAQFVKTLSISRLIPESFVSTYARETLTPLYVTPQEIIYSAVDYSYFGDVLKYVLFRYNYVEDKLSFSEDLKSNLSIIHSNFPKFSGVSSAGFTIQDFKNRKLTYDFDKQISSIDDTDFQSDSLAVVNNQQLIITDNIYRSEGNLRVPLVQPSEVFDPKKQRFLVKEQLQDKLLLLSTDNSGLPGFELVSLDINNKVEKLLKVGDESFFLQWGSNSGSHFTEFMGNAYFIYRNSTNGYQVYTTAGTAATTSKVGSFSSEQLGIVQKLANEKQLVYSVREIFTNKAFALIIEKGKISKIPLTGNFVSFYQTPNATYYTTASELFDGSGSLYLLKDGKSELIAESVKRTIVVGNSLFYAKFREGTNSFLGAFEYKDNTEKLIAIRSFSNFKKLDNRIVLSNNAGTSYLVYDVDRGEELFRSEQSAIGKTEGKLINGAIVFAGTNSVLIAKGSTMKTVELDKSFQKTEVFESGIGFIIAASRFSESHSYSDVFFYNLRTMEIQEIQTPVPIERIEAETNRSYALLSERIRSGSGTNRSFNYWFWDETMADIKKIDFNESFGDLLASAGKYLIERNYTGNPFMFRIWSHSFGRFEVVAEILETDAIVQLYQREGKPPVAFSYANLNSFKNSKVKQYTLNETVEFPAINAAKGGAKVYEVFPFREKLYAHAFTYADGWQIWDLGKFVEEEFSVNGPLANEETLLQVNVFPNPTADEITVTAAEPVSVELLDLFGRSMKKLDAKKIHRFSIGSLPTGTYFLRISNSKISEVKKVVKR